MKTPPCPAPAERGAALIVALLFLVILALLGTTGVMNNTLQERMAGNARNRDLAFEAAEHALETADAWLMTQNKASMRLLVDSSGVDLVANDGVRTSGEAHANDTGYWQSTFNWSSTDLKSASGVAGVAANPRYVVERLPSYTTSGMPPVTYDYYRVTTRGVGGVAEATVILQTLYQFP